MNKTITKIFISSSISFITVSEGYVSKNLSISFKLLKFWTFISVYSILIFVLL